MWSFDHSHCSIVLVNISPVFCDFNNTYNYRTPAVALLILYSLVITVAILYTAKLSLFQSIAEVFPSNHLLCTVHYGHGLMHRESSSEWCILCKTAKVLPYTVVKMCCTMLYYYC